MIYGLHAIDSMPRQPPRDSGRSPAEGKRGSSACGKRVRWRDHLAEGLGDTPDAIARDAPILRVLRTGRLSTGSATGRLPQAALRQLAALPK